MFGVAVKDLDEAWKMWHLHQKLQLLVVELLAKEEKFSEFKYIIYD